MRAGDCYTFIPDFALLGFNVVLSLNPRNDVALADRASLYLRKGEFKLCLEDCDDSLAINANNGAALALRDDIYRRERKFNLARADLTRALIINPNNTFALTTRGEVYRQQRAKEHLI